jgi:hypothetical protein
MKQFAAGLVAALGFAGFALADGPSGQTYEINIPSADLTYTTAFHADGRMEDSLGRTGVWTYEDGVLCAGSENAPLCNPFEPTDVGESVTTTQWTEDGTEMIITRVE